MQASLRLPHHVVDYQVPRDLDLVSEKLAEMQASLRLLHHVVDYQVPRDLDLVSELVAGGDAGQPASTPPRGRLSGTT